MKRVALQRKTPLRRSPGKRMRRTCLKRMSPAKASMQREYAQVTEASRERCEKACIPERHHTQSRIGRNLLVFRWLCAGCHSWVHSNARAARKEGWLK